MLATWTTTINTTNDTITLTQAANAFGGSVLLKGGAAANDK